jgi:hypothetical protein
VTRHRRPRRHDRIPALRRGAGWDVVRTPFGERFVPRGEGWREAAKWSAFRLAAAAAGIALLLALLILIHSAIR